MKYVVVLLCFIDLGAAHSCEGYKAKADCSAVFTREYAFAYFPVLKEKDGWQWYRIARTPERQEYAWIAEPGTCKKNVFVGNGVVFAASLGLANLDSVPPGEGTLADLLELASKNAYFSKIPLAKEEEEQNLLFIHRSVVRAKLVEDGNIMLAPVDPDSIRAVKRNSPTHMRMQAILPSLDESYECIVRIEHLVLPHEVHHK